MSSAAPQPPPGGKPLGTHVGRLHLDILRWHCATAHASTPPCANLAFMLSLHNASAAEKAQLLQRRHAELSRNRTAMAATASEARSAYAAMLTSFCAPAARSHHHSAACSNAPLRAEYAKLSLTAAAVTALDKAAYRALGAAGAESSPPPSLAPPPPSRLPARGSAAPDPLTPSK